MLAIRICEQNLSAITELNDGVRPRMESETTFFVFNPNGYNAIVTSDDLQGEYSFLQDHPLDTVYNVKKK